MAEQVKARKPWTPVVIITGYGTDAAEARAKAAGVSSFMHKPLSPEMIEDSARDALAAPAPQVVALPPAAEAPEAVPARSGSALLNILLFFAAPFIGLAYIVVFPFVGLGAMAVLAARLANKNPRLHAIGVTMKNVAMVLAAPVFGLVYIMLFPFIGLVSLLWLAGRALRNRELNANGQLAPRPAWARRQGRGTSPALFCPEKLGFHRWILFEPQLYSENMHLKIFISS